MAKTIEDIKAERAAAGAAYQAAAEAYFAAWTELHAYDLAMQNGNVGGVTASVGRFNQEPTAVDHPDFRITPWHAALARRAHGRHDQIVAEMAKAEA